jgi:hypothetical protein
MHSPPASDLADRKRACRNAAVKARAWAHGLGGTTSGAKLAAGGFEFLDLGPGLAVSDVWSIPVPVNSAPEIEPDVLIVPMLAFDSAGYRLGYGGGVYDRTLGRLRATKPVVAVDAAFAGQEVAHVPRGCHDEPLDWILTEHGAKRPVAGLGRSCG